MNERVRYVGDSVAIVAAQTQDIAEQAVRLIEAEFEAQPVITSAVQARQGMFPICINPETCSSTSKSAKATWNKASQKRMS